MFAVSGAPGIVSGPARLLSSDGADLRLMVTAPGSVIVREHYVDARRVGFHAHSQGATLAPLAAARIGNPAFIIASAPGGVPMREMEIFSVENALGFAA